MYYLLWQRVPKMICLSVLIQSYHWTPRLKHLLFPSTTLFSKVTIPAFIPWPQFAILSKASNVCKHSWEWTVVYPQRRKEREDWHSQTEIEAYNHETPWNMSLQPTKRSLTVSLNCASILSAFSVLKLWRETSHEGIASNVSEVIGCLEEDFWAQDLLPLLTAFLPNFH